MAGAAITGQAFYVAGGNLLPDAQSYVVRPADTELFNAIRGGSYCYVLTSRQMGKSSLMHRTSVKLSEAGILPVILDLTAIGANLSVDQWYYGLLVEIARQLSLQPEIEAYWATNSRHGPLYRFIHALSDLVLERTSSPVAIFIDEIDFVRGLKGFSTDEFFAGIRQCFNSRANNPRMQRLTFCLLGVATPADLIQDVHTTPFNIGVQIELADFTEEEASALSIGLDPDSATAHSKLDRIMHWTGGHPYLTQKLCLAVSERSGCDIDYVDILCHQMFLAAGVRRTEDNLIFVHNTLRNSPEDLASVLRMYSQVLKGARVPNDHSDPTVALLRLAGVVRVVHGRLVVRNTIYARVFDRAWVEENMPDAYLRRERAAYRRGLWRSGLFFGAITLIVTVLGWEAVYQKDMATASERAATRNFEDAGNNLYVADMNLTQQQFIKNDVQGAMGLLNTHQSDPRRSFDWNWLWSRIHADQYATFTNTSTVYSMEFSQDGSLLAEGLNDGTVLLWTRPFLKPTSTFCREQYPVMGLSFTKKGKELDLITEAMVVQVWDVPARRLISQWKISGADTRDMSASSDGSVIAVAEKHSVELFDRSGKLKALFTPAGRTECSAVGISPDGQILAAGYQDGSVWVWNMSTGAQLLRLKHQITVNSIVFSADNSMIATGSSDSTACVWNAATGSKIESFACDNKVYCVAFAGNGRWLAAAGKDTAVRLWDIRSGESLGLFEGHTGTVRTVTLTPNGKFLASGGFDNSTIIWNVDPSKYTIPLQGVLPDTPSSYAFSADGIWVATADTIGKVIVWNALTGQKVHTFILDHPAFGLVAFDPNRSYIYIGGLGGRLKVYETIHWSRVMNIPGDGLDVTQAQAFIISPNGQYLLEGGSNRATLWDIKQGKEIMLAPESAGPERPVAFTQDSLEVAAWQAQPSQIALWSTRSGQEIQGGGFPVPVAPSGGGAFTRDGRELLLGNVDGTVTCWDRETKRQTISISDQSSGQPISKPGASRVEPQVCAIALVSDGSVLKTVSSADKIHVW